MPHFPNGSAILNTLPSKCYTATLLTIGTCFKIETVCSAVHQMPPSVFV